MANDSAKKLKAANEAIMQRYRLILLGCNALYILFRIYYLYDTFSGWHTAGFALTTTIYGIVRGAQACARARISEAAR